MGMGSGFTPMDNVFPRPTFVKERGSSQASVKPKGDKPPSLSSDNNQSPSERNSDQNSKSYDFISKLNPGPN